MYSFLYNAGLVYCMTLFYFKSDTLKKVIKQFPAFPKVTKMAALGNMCARYTLFSLKQLPRRFDFAQRHFPVSPTGKEYHSRVPAVHLSSTTGNVLSVSGCRTWKAHLYWLNCQSRNIAPLLSLSHCRLYSNRRGSLTDDLLKAKIAADKAATDESNNSGDNKDEQDQKKEEKKSRFAGFTGKNAWKLGIIFLGGMSVFASGSLLILWGMYVTMCRV